MPELPEVESVRVSLRPLVGRRIVAASLHRADVCITPTGGRARQVDLLVGLSIVELRRRGKQLAIVAEDGRTLVVHLGMSGQLRLLRRGEDPTQRDHVHAAWSIDDGSQLTFRDPRRFGGLWLLPSRAALDARWAGLGPDALDITTEELADAARGSRRAIKALLLDQGALAGVGNIYADESLFAARIRPTRFAHRIRPEECRCLATAIRETLRGAIRAGGSTLRDYVNAAGRSGEAQHRHAVYGRAGEPCMACGKTLRCTTIAQRTTVFCTGCQH